MRGQSVFAIVLAAGEGSRFGSTKQLTVFDGESLVARAMRLAEEVCGDRTVLVIGSDWQRVLAACGPQRGFFVRNESYKSGIAGSIVGGVKTAAHVADAVLLMMADQPLLTAEHLDSLLGEWKRSDSDIVISEYAGVRGPPVVFPAHCFDRLMKLVGDHGARSIVSDSRHSVKAVVFDPAAVDIDTTDDLENLQSR